MKIKLFLILQFFALSAFADTFEIISSKKPVTLTVTYKNNLVRSYKLRNGRTLKFLFPYKKICSKSDDSEYEVGIKNRPAISLKKSSPCYYYHPSNEKQLSLLERFVITFRWIQQELRLESNYRRLIPAIGREEGDINISKSKYSFLKLKFDKNDDIQVTKLFVIQKDKTSKEFIVPGNCIYIKQLEIGQEYLIQMIKTNGNIAVSQRFVIVK